MVNGGQKSRAFLCSSQARPEESGPPGGGLSSVRQGAEEIGWRRVDPASAHGPLRIAYVGPAFGTSLHRIRALERLGHTVALVDPWTWLDHSKWVGRWLHRTGGIGLGLFIDRPLFKAVEAARPELIFVNQGAFLGPALLQRLRSLHVPILNYTNDNPFSARDGLRFRYYRSALKYYDLLAIVREENVSQAKRWGARNVMRVWMTADEIAHRPHELKRETLAHFASDVSFVGTWMPERGSFMTALISRGVPLSIWGDRWQKAPEWPVIAPYWRGPGIYNDCDYAAAIQSAKVSLGLLSKGNRDLHTTRSIEIPALGGLLCAEHTLEHLALYAEDREAVYWKDAQECAEKCLRLLADEPLRSEISRRGHERAKRNNLYNEPMLAALIERAMRLHAQTR